jgi:hypothetical protein
VIDTEAITLLGRKLLHHSVKHGGGTMECPKCNGLMQLERMSDFFLVFFAWKCINCGALIDKTIATNRRQSVVLSKIGSEQGGYRMNEGVC